MPAKSVKRPHAIAAVALAALTGTTFGFALDRGEPGAHDPPLFVMMYEPGAAWDTALPANEQRHFDTHSANLRRLRADGTIVAGGRFDRWGLILVRAGNLEAARALFEADSSLASGTFEGDVHPWSTIYDGFIPR